MKPNTASNSPIYFIKQERAGKPGKRPWPTSEKAIWTKLLYAKPPPRYCLNPQHLSNPLNHFN